MKAAFWRSVWWHLRYPGLPADAAPQAPERRVVTADEAAGLGLDVQPAVPAETVAPYSRSGSDAFHARCVKALHDADHHSCQMQDGVDYVVLADAVTRVRDKNMQVMREWVAELSAQGGADPWRCPACGPTPLEPHPRLPVMRCSNCKEHAGTPTACPGCGEPYRKVPGGHSCTHKSDCMYVHQRGAQDGYEATTGHAITCGAGFGMGCQCDTVAVPRDTLRGLVEVADYVAPGRHGVDPAEPYPDEEATRALAALDDAGLLDQFRGEET